MGSVIALSGDICSYLAWRAAQMPEAPKKEAKKAGSRRVLGTHRPCGTSCAPFTVHMLLFWTKADLSQEEIG